MRVNKEPRIDMLAYRRKEQSERLGNLRNIAILGLLALLLLGGMGTVWYLQNQQVETLQTENKQLQRKIDSLTKTVDGMDASLDNKKSGNSRQSILSNLEAAAQVKSIHLRKIYQLSIPEITIGKLDMKSNNEFVMTAYCNSQAKFIKYLGQLRELDFIKDVKNISSKSNEKTGEVSFNLTLVWEVE